MSKSLYFLFNVCDYACLHAHMYTCTVLQGKRAISFGGGGGKRGSLGLVTSTDIIKTTFVIFLHKLLSPYIANREAIHIRVVLEEIFANFGQKWQYLRNTLELKVQIWESKI